MDLPFNASVIPGANNMLPHTMATPVASNGPQGATAAFRECKDPVGMFPLSMDQIWETLTKISISVEKVHMSQTAAQAETIPTL